MWRLCDQGLTMAHLCYWETPTNIHRWSDLFHSFYHTKSHQFRVKTRKGVLGVTVGRFTERSILSLDRLFSHAWYLIIWWSLAEIMNMNRILKTIDLYRYFWQLSLCGSLVRFCFIDMAWLRKIHNFSFAQVEDVRGLGSMCLDSHRMMTGGWGWRQRWHYTRHSMIARKESQETLMWTREEFMKRHVRTKPLGHCHVGIGANSRSISSDPLPNDPFGRSAIQGLHTSISFQQRR